MDGVTARCHRCGKDKWVSRSLALTFVSATARSGPSSMYGGAPATPAAESRHLTAKIIQFRHGRVAGQVAPHLIFEHQAKRGIRLQ